MEHFFLISVTDIRDDFIFVQMKIYLEYYSPSGKQHTFCIIESTVDGFLMIEEGPVGEKGQKRRARPKGDLEQACEALKEKYIKAGFVEGEKPTIQITSDLKELLDARDFIPALKNYFRYLVTAEEMMPIFETVMETGIKASIIDDELVVKFQTATLRASLHPTSPEQYLYWPTSFREIVSRHQWIEFPQSGWALYIGDVKHKNNTQLTFSEILKSAGCRIPASKLGCPMIDYGAFLFYHPSIKNVHGEPALFQADPVNGHTGNPINWKVGDLFLLKAAQVIDLDHAKLTFPKIPYV